MKGAVFENRLKGLFAFVLRRTHQFLAQRRWRQIKRHYALGQPCGLIVGKDCLPNRRDLFVKLNHRDVASEVFGRHGQTHDAAARKGFDECRWPLFQPVPDARNQPRLAAGIAEGAELAHGSHIDDVMQRRLKQGLLHNDV